MVVPFRDPVSGLTHMIAALLAVLATVLLILRSVDPAMPWHIVTFSIFGGGMILLYTASTLYHWLPVSEAGVRFLRRVDHSMIFFYIAATYTPICLIPLRGPWGWSLFGVIWGLALAGIVMKIFWMHAPRWLSTGIYLAMGWMVLVGAYPLVMNLSTGALGLAGGRRSGLFRGRPWSTPSSGPIPGPTVSGSTKYSTSSSSAAASATSWSCIGLFKHFSTQIKKGARTGALFSSRRCPVRVGTSPGPRPWCRTACRWPSGWSWTSRPPGSSPG